MFIIIVDLHPTGIIGQWNTERSNPLHISKWIFLPYQPKRTASTIFKLIAQLIIKCHPKCLQLKGRDVSKIVIPVQQAYFEWCLANSIPLQIALHNCTGRITYHLPSHNLLRLSKTSVLSQKSLNLSWLQRATIFMGFQAAAPTLRPGRVTWAR